MTKTEIKVYDQLLKNVFSKKNQRKLVGKSVYVRLKDIADATNTATQKLRKMNPKTKTKAPECFLIGDKHKCVAWAGLNMDKTKLAVEDVVGNVAELSPFQVRAVANRLLDVANYLENKKKQ